MTEIGPGTPLICKEYWRLPTAYPWVPDLTVGAMYICEAICESSKGGLCPWDGCSLAGISPKGKNKYLFCQNFFRPLNDGDTSLVENEREEDSSVLQSGMNILDEAFKEKVDV